MRNRNVDVLKAMAIIAVVLYHLGICEFGYLGVDMFLVIAGYFTSKSIDNQIINGGGYLRFVANRLFRLWPLLLIAGAACLCFGWMMMLPDDYENTAQSVIATNYFGNNVLQAITTKNYWQVANQYRPLMHTWYVGLIMQYYIIIPFLLFAFGKRIKDHDIRKKIDIMLMVIIGGVSLFGYLTEGNAAYKFYYLPYRLFEFCAGSLVFYLSGKVEKTTGNKVRFSIGFIITYLSIVVLLFVDSEYMSRSVKLSLIVIFTAALLTMMSWVKLAQGIVFSNKWLAYIGAASFSIFVWHQVVVALIRYSFTKDITATLPFLAFLSITALLSYLSYKYVEQMKKTKITWTGIVLMLIVTTVFSLHIYINAGVVRDVPELEVEEGNGHRGMWAEYCDRGYQYDKDFTDSNRPKWYIIGNSFGRDMINVILESRIADMVEISYSDMHSYQNRLNRFAEADVVILSTLMVDEIKIADVQERCSNKKPFFIIGEKNFGECNGQVYRHRFAKDYHQLTVEMEEGYAEKNERLKAAYSDIYIDMIEMVRQPDGKVRVFSDDGRFISQDCRHLTKAGAQYYASLFEWERFLK